MADDRDSPLKNSFVDGGQKEISNFVSEMVSYVTYVTPSLHEFRLRTKFAQKYWQQIDQTPFKDLSQPPPVIAKPLLESMALRNEDDLVGEKAAVMLANACRKSTSHWVHPKFAMLLGEMVDYEIGILESINKNKLNCFLGTHDGTPIKNICDFWDDLDTYYLIYEEVKSAFTGEEVQLMHKCLMMDVDSIPIDKMFVIIDHLQALGLIDLERLTEDSFKNGFFKGDLMASKINFNLLKAFMGIDVIFDGVKLTRLGRYFIQALSEKPNGGAGINCSPY